jgi:hypothetical protein
MKTICLYRHVLPKRLFGFLAFAAHQCIHDPLMLGKRVFDPVQ